MKTQKCNRCGESYTGAYHGMACTECFDGVIVEEEVATAPELTPEQVVAAARILTPIPPATVARPELPSDGLRARAKNTHVVALLFLVLAPVVAVGGLVLRADDSPAHLEPLLWAGSLMGCAFLVELLAQLLFIRAALEDRSGR